MNPRDTVFLDIVFIQGSSIFELFAGEHKLLLVRQNIFLILNFDHRISNCIIWVDFKSNSLTRKNLNRDFHNEIYQIFTSSTRHVHSVRVFSSCREALASPTTSSPGSFLRSILSAGKRPWYRLVTCLLERICI